MNMQSSKKHSINDLLNSICLNHMLFPHVAQLISNFFTDINFNFPNQEALSIESIQKKVSVARREVFLEVQTRNLKRGIDPKLSILSNLAECEEVLKKIAFVGYIIKLYEIYIPITDQSHPFYGEIQSILQTVKDFKHFYNYQQMLESYEIIKEQHGKLRQIDLAMDLSYTQRYQGWLHESSGKGEKNSVLETLLNLLQQVKNLQKEVPGCKSINELIQIGAEIEKIYNKLDQNISIIKKIQDWMVKLCSNFSKKMQILTLHLSHDDPNYLNYKNQFNLLLELKDSAVSIDDIIQKAPRMEKIVDQLLEIEINKDFQETLNSLVEWQSIEWQTIQSIPLPKRPKFIKIPSQFVAFEEKEPANMHHKEQFPKRLFSPPVLLEQQTPVNPRSKLYLQVLADQKLTANELALEFMTWLRSYYPKAAYTRDVLPKRLLDSDFVYQLRNESMDFKTLKAKVDTMMRNYDIGVGKKDAFYEGLEFFSQKIEQAILEEQLPSKGKPS